MRTSASAVNWWRLKKTPRRWADQTKKVAELFELSERERNQLLGQVQSLRGSVGAVRELGQSVTANVAKTLEAFKRQVLWSLQKTGESLRKARRAQGFAQNGFEITYSKRHQPSPDPKGTSMQAELASLTHRNQALTSELTSLKNVNQLLLEKLKMTEEKEKKNAERFSSTFAGSLGQGDSGLTKRNDSRGETGEGLQIRTENSALKSATRDRVGGRESSGRPLEDYLTPKNNRAAKPPKEFNEDIYIARYKHEEVLEETVSKLKQRHLQEIQRLRDEFEDRLNKEISQELERALESFQQQKKLFDERNLQQEKEDRAKKEQISKLQNDLMAVKQELAEATEQQMKGSKRMESLVSDDLVSTPKAENFNSPGRREAALKWTDSPIAERDQSVERLREEVHNLSQKLQEAIYTIDQDQIVFEDFKVLKDGLELKVKSLSRNLEAESRKLAMARADKEALEKDIEELKAERAFLDQKVEDAREKIEVLVAEKEELRVKMEENEEEFTANIVKIGKKSKLAIEKHKKAYQQAVEKVQEQREEIKRLQVFIEAQGKGGVKRKAEIGSEKLETLKTPSKIGGREKDPPTTQSPPIPTVTEPLGATSRLARAKSKPLK